MLCLPFDGSRLILESYFLFLGGRCHSWIRGRNPLLGHSPRIGPIVSAVRFGSRCSLLLFALSDRLLHFRVFPAGVSLTIHFDPVLRLVWSCDFSASVIALPQGCYRCPCCWFSLHRCSLLDSGAAGGGAVTACYRPLICFRGWLWPVASFPGFTGPCAATAVICARAPGSSACCRLRRCCWVAICFAGRSMPSMDSRSRILFSGTRRAPVNSLRAFLCLVRTALCL